MKTWKHGLLMGAMTMAMAATAGAQSTNSQADAADGGEATGDDDAQRHPEGMRQPHRARNERLRA